MKTRNMNTNKIIFLHKFKKINIKDETKSY